MRDLNFINGIIDIAEPKKNELSGDINTLVFLFFFSQAFFPF